MTPPPTLRHWARHAGLAVLLVGGFLAGFGWWTWSAWWSTSRTTSLLTDARRALARGAFEDAERRAIVAAKATHDPWAWIVAGEAAVRDQRFDDALRHYEQVRTGDLGAQSAAAHGRAEMCLQLRRWRRAEAEYRAALTHQPDNLTALRRLVDLQNLTGRRDHAVPGMRRLLGTPAGSLEDLFYLGDVDHAIRVPDEYRLPIPADDTDPLLSLSLGYEALGEQRIADAERWFQAAAEHEPDDPDALAGWGLALILQPDRDLALWQTRLTPTHAEHPAIQTVLGLLAERDGRLDAAVEAFRRAVAGRPTSRVAWHRLGQSLSRLDRKTEAALALERARELQQIALWLDDLFQHRTHAELLRRLTHQLAAIGRLPEALAWANYTSQVAPSATWVPEFLQQAQHAPATLINAEREAAVAALLVPASTALRIVESPPAFETPHRNAPNNPTLATSSESPLTTSSPVFEFTDEAATTGLVFVHHSARDPQTPGARILETTGGGVGVLDYDHDGWPDLYFPQGSREFPLPGDIESDQAFRNRFGIRWENVTRPARFHDHDFSQGIATGDFDHDGFVDLYVANYGVNRLWRNQGDGTFVDVTPPAIRMAADWTTSCLIADVNDDGHPDLFDVTYRAGGDVETRICERQGRPRSCSPRAFAPARDRVWLGDGAGDFVPPTQDDGLELPDGLGLGIIAFRPTADQPISLFIANDEAPNFWLQRAGPGSNRWRDVGLLSGLSVDAEGKPQACMGVACDDFDGNGLFDLFVTNFYQESNTLYAALSTDLYEDRTRPTGLREPSWSMLGFGTQALDIDLDGRPDLVVANGHIDDLSSLGQPYEMPVQFFANRGGRFVEVHNPTPLRKTIGRGLARLDANRDGREDVVIANQDSPALLLRNHTQPQGRSLTLRLSGTHSPRDAIGAIVRVTCGDRTLIRQLTAGDGYMASNERQLVIGLGMVDRIDHLAVAWPKGAVTAAEGLVPDRTFLIREGTAPLLISDGW